MIKMLQDLLRPNKNAEKVIRIKVEERADEFIALIDKTVNKRLNQDRFTESRKQLLDFAANILEINFRTEKDVLSFLNSTMKEINNEKKIDSWNLTILSFILGACTAIIWTKYKNKEN